MKNQIVASIVSVPFALGAVLAGTGAANAASLSGNISINGNLTSTTSGGVTTLDFVDIDDIVTNGDFANFDFDFTGTGPDATLPTPAPNFIDIQDLNLTPTGFSPSVDPLVSFLDFGERTLDGEVGNLTFDLFEPDEVTISPFFVAFDAVGVWQFNGETLAEGAVAVTQVGTGGYTLTLETIEKVPEPTALFGLGVVATGLVASRRRKNA